MSKRNDDEIPVSVAARMLGSKCTRTLRNLADAGLIEIRKAGGRWVVRRDEVLTAKVLTLGRAAKLARCSKSTVCRRVKDGLVEPYQPPRSIEPAARTPFPRFSLEDVSVIRRSLQWRPKRRPIKKKPARQSRESARSREPELRLLQDRAGQLFLRVGTRLFKLTEVIAS